jgi:hypothetical protein
VQDVVEQVDRLVPGRRQLGGGPGIGDDADLAPVRVIPFPAHESRALQAVDHARDAAGRQAGQLREPARRERAVDVEQGEEP